jgi:hypothetical protein
LILTAVKKFVKGDGFMLWCPICKYEYRDGFTICSDCGSKLVAELEIINKEETKCREIIEDDVEAFLVTVNGDVEAIILESKLNSYGIPTLRKYQGFGSYLAVGGKKTFIDIYVPSKLIGQANDLINTEAIE